MGLVIASDADSFGETERDTLKGALVLKLGCAPPSCYLTLQVAGGSLAINVVLSIPEDSSPGGVDGDSVGGSVGASGSAASAVTIAALRASAMALAAAPLAELSASLGVSVEQTVAVSVQTGKVMPIVVAPPPPFPPPPPLSQPQPSSPVQLPSSPASASPSLPSYFDTSAGLGASTGDTNGDGSTVIAIAVAAAVGSATVLGLAFLAYCRRRARASRTASPRTQSSRATDKNTAFQEGSSGKQYTPTRAAVQAPPRACGTAPAELSLDPNPMRSLPAPTALPPPSRATGEVGGSATALTPSVPPMTPPTPNPMSAIPVQVDTSTARIASPRLFLETLLATSEEGRPPVKQPVVSPRRSSLRYTLSPRPASPRARVHPLAATASFVPIQLDAISDIDEIAVGQFGTVYACMYAGTRCAVKVTGSKALLRCLANEYEVMMQLRHPNVLLMIGIATDVTQPDIDAAILMELMETSLAHMLASADFAPFCTWSRSLLAIATDVANGMGCMLPNLDPWGPLDICVPKPYRCSPRGAGIEFRHDRPTLQQCGPLGPEARECAAQRSLDRQGV